MKLLSRIWATNRISIRLLKVTFSIYMIVTVALTAIHLRIEYNHIKQNVITDIYASLYTLKGGITQALWTANVQQLKQLIHGYNTFHFVDGIVVSSDILGDLQKGKIHKEAFIIPSEKLRQSDPQISSPVFKPLAIQMQLVQEDAVLGDTSLGVITVYSNSEIIWNRLKESFQVIIVNAIIKTLVLWTLFLVVGNFLLGRPLNELTAAVRHLDVNKIEKSKIRWKGKAKDELGLYAESFNKMLDIISDTMEELDQINRNLEEEVQRRADKILEHEETIRQSEAKMYLADKLSSLGMLVAGVSHEMNNFITYSSISAENLERSIDGLQASLDEVCVGSSPEEAKLYFSKEFERLQKMLKPLLEGMEQTKNIMMKMKMFVHQEEEGVFSLVKVYDEVEMNTTLIQTEYKHSVQFHNQVPESSVFQVRRGEFNQVIMNVMTNACHAILASENASGSMGNVWVSAYQKDGFDVLEIKDDGIGIPAEKLEKISRPFYTTKPAGEGSGLGLSIADRILRNHGGRIEIQSQEGSGTVVSLIVPARTESG